MEEYQRQKNYAEAEALFGIVNQALGIASGWGSIGGDPPPLELCTDHAFVTASIHNPSGKFGYM